MLFRSEDGASIGLGGIEIKVSKSGYLHLARASIGLGGIEIVAYAVDIGAIIVLQSDWGELK